MARSGNLLGLCRRFQDTCYCPHPYAADALRIIHDRSETSSASQTSVVRGTLGVGMRARKSQRLINTGTRSDDALGVVLLT